MAELRWAAAALRGCRYEGLWWVVVLVEMCQSELGGGMEVWRWFSYCARCDEMNLRYG